MNRSPRSTDPRPLPTTGARRCRIAVESLRCRWIAAVHLAMSHPRVADVRAQSTVEYALVLLGAAAVALALIAWVTRSDAVGRLFDAVIGRVLRQAG